MTSKFQLLRSETTRNIVRNPSVEVDLADWQHIGSGVARSQNEARFGAYAARVFTNGLSDNEGVYVRSIPNTQATPYFGSVYVRGMGNVRLRMRDATNGLDFVTDPINLETDPGLAIPACEPNHLVFGAGGPVISCSSDASIDDLPSTTDFTLEAWARADSDGGFGLGVLFDKRRLIFHITAGRLRASADFVVDALSTASAADWSADGLWHHLAVTFELAIRTFRIFVDGFEVQYVIQDAGVGAYVSDAAEFFLIGDDFIAGANWDGDIGWTRVSTTLRYTENFDPPGRCALPEIDNQTLAQWIGVEADGEGPLVENQEGTAALDGTETATAMGCSCVDPGVGRRWHRLEVRGQTGDQPSDDLRLIVETDGIQGTVFYVDGAQIEQKDYVTTYIDGDQPGGEWNVVEHATVSDRVRTERSGGRLIEVNEDAIGMYVTAVGGIGMPPLRHNLQGRALLPGMEFQSTKILARPVSISFWAKNPDACPGNLKLLHELRQNLIDIVRPDRNAPDQPFVVRYNGSARPVEISAYYEAGLEFDGDIRNQYTNSFMVRALATDPFWIEDDQEVDVLGFANLVGLADGVLQEVDGVWQDWGGMTGAAAVGGLTMAIAPDGRVYVGGLFANINGVVVNNIAYWDGAAWNPLTNGLNDSPSTLAIASDGTVYAGGSFVSEFGGGLALERIASWSPVTETWSALGPGLNGLVMDIQIAPDGEVYVGGVFDDVFGGGGNSLNRITRWDPDNLTFNAMGAGPGLAGGQVEALTIAEDGATIYLGGFFDREFGGVAGDIDNIAAFDVAANTFSELGGGMTAGVSVLEAQVADDGSVFFGGSFTELGGVSVTNAARWNGSAYGALTSGVNGEVNTIEQTADGLVWFGGFFNTAGGLLLSDGFAAWNGSAWIRPPVDLPLTFAGLGLRVRGINSHEGNFYIVGDFNGTPNGEMAVTAATTLVQNLGSAEVKPTLEVEGPGVMAWLENRTAGTIIFMDYTLQAGEIVTIDFETGSVISSWRGNVIGEVVLPQSDFAAFRLLPGENQVLLYVANSTTDTKAQLRYIPQHWSVDGTEP